MSIKALTRELYRAQQQVAALEKRVEEAPLAACDEIREELRQVRAEWTLLRKMLDGEKETGLSRQGRRNPFLRG